MRGKRGDGDDRVGGVGVGGPWDWSAKKPLTGVVSGERGR